MKIRYQSAVEMARMSQYGAALQEHFKRVAASDTVVDLHGAPAGTWGDLQPAKVSGYPAIFHAIMKSIFIRAALDAERDGYDAFILGTSIDPALREIRSLVDIPVISMSETAILVACTIASKIAIITPTDETGMIVCDHLENSGFGARISSVEVISPALADDALNAALGNPDELLQRFTQTAQKAIQKGAEAIFPAEGILAEVVAGNGLADIDGAQILDPIGLAVGFAEMRIHMRHKLNLQTARRQCYRKPPPELMAHLFPSI